MLEDETLTGRIIGAGVQVHRELGPGFLESIYESALVIELENRVIPFERQLRIPVIYKNTKVGAHRLDLVVADKVVVEIKAVHELQSAFFRVVRSYMRATQLNIGLILNFGTPFLEVKRVFPSAEEPTPHDRA
ncbi:MAG: GxxExxY protein [Acidobacteriota bacterium]|nr:MAG: GxxExxY protein [Acidobacteriota bacterium]